MKFKLINLTCLLAIAISGGLQAAPNEAVITQKDLHFQENRSKTIRVSTTKTKKRYEFCKNMKCEVIGEVPNVAFLSDDPRFVGKEAGNLLTGTEKLLHGVMIVSTVVGVMALKFKIDEKAGPGSQGSPSQPVLTSLLTLALGIFSGNEIGKVTSKYFKEWVIGDELSVYESEALLNTLVYLDSQMAANWGIPGHVSLFKSDLRLAISSVNTILEVE